MGFIPDEVVNEVRSRADIVQIIGESVTLKKVGRRMVGLCPFHKDTKPSFYVSPERGAFKCFGCGIGGDVFRFIMETQRLTFPESVRYLADRLGIEVPEASGSTKPRGYRERLLTANEAALSFFRERLAHPEAGRAARDYLKSRDVSDEMIDRFALGFAPDSWDQLLKYIRHKGIAPDDAANVGLIAPREKGDGYYDRFRNRLMFPVHNAVGRVVAFSGRLLAGDGPKYINSPESDLFVKGRTFYGLHLAGKEIGKRDQAFVCEGNFDIISLHQHKMPQAVAALGTAFTEGHAALLERYTKNLVFIFDGDQAGQKAMAKLLEVYLSRDEQPQVVVLPEGEDPDSFLKSQGPAPMGEMIKTAPFLLDFVVDRVFGKHGGSDEEMARALEECCSIAARVRNPIRRGLLAKQLATRTRVAEETIRQQINRRQRGRKAQPVKREKESHRLLPGAEKTILATLLHYPKVAGKVDRESLLMVLPAGPMQTIAERIIRVAAETGEIAAEVIMHPDDDDALTSLAGELLMQPAPCKPDAAEQALADAIQDRERRLLAEEVAAVKAQLAHKEQDAMDTRYDELVRRLYALQKRMSELR